VKANKSLYFPGVEHFRDALTKVFDDLQETETFLNRTVVIDMSLVHKVDHTSLKVRKFNFYQKAKIKPSLIYSLFRC